MAETASTMLALGTSAPHFDLPDTEGSQVTLLDFQDERALLVMFICNHCPYVKHVRKELARMGKEFQQKGVAVVAISSNDAAAYPDDSPAMMKREKQQAEYTFPYLYDEAQAVARAFRAACTPDFFLFGPDRRLVYRGQMDGARPGNNVPVTGADLRAAVDAVVAGRPVPPDQKPSLGCNIKWK